MIEIWEKGIADLRSLWTGCGVRAARTSPFFSRLSFNFDPLGVVRGR